MIQINPREIAAEAMVQIMAEGAYNNGALRRLLRQNGAMSRQDRAFVTEVVNGTLRNLYYLDYILNTFSKVRTEKMKPWILAVLRTASMPAAPGWVSLALQWMLTNRSAPAAEARPVRS